MVSFPKVPDHKPGSNLNIKDDKTEHNAKSPSKTDMSHLKRIDSNKFNQLIFSQQSLTILEFRPSQNYQSDHINHKNSINFDTSTKNATFMNKWLKALQESKDLLENVCIVFSNEKDSIVSMCNHQSLNIQQIVQIIILQYNPKFLSILTDSYEHFRVAFPLSCVQTNKTTISNPINHVPLEMKDVILQSPTNKQLITPKPPISTNGVSEQNCSREDILKTIPLKAPLNGISTWKRTENARPNAATYEASNNLHNLMESSVLTSKKEDEKLSNSVKEQVAHPKPSIEARSRFADHEFKIAPANVKDPLKEITEKYSPDNNKKLVIPSTEETKKISMSVFSSATSSLANDGHRKITSFEGLENSYKNQKHGLACNGHLDGPTKGVCHESSATTTDATSLPYCNDFISPPAKYSVPTTTAFSSNNLNSISGTGALFNNTTFDRSTKPVIETQHSEYTANNLQTSISLYERPVCEPYMVGLDNNRMICYMNSVIQSLFSVSEFRNIISRAYVLETTPPRLDLINTLHYYMTEVMKGKRYYLPMDKMEEVVFQLMPHLTRGMQQDAHEFMLLLISAIEDSIKEIYVQIKKESGETGAVSNLIETFDQLFYGVIKYKYTCAMCQSGSYSSEKFSHLTLPLCNESDTPYDGEDINSCLKRYFLIETIPLSYQWKCSNCDCVRIATKTPIIERLPRLLILHLSRNFKNGQKIQSLITYPMETLNFEFPLSKDFNSKRLNIPNYNLMSVVQHYGLSVYSGHYAAFCRRPVPNESRYDWFRYDDRRVDPINKDSTSDVVSPSGYLLFYCST